MFLEVLRGGVGCEFVLLGREKTRGGQHQRVVEFSGPVRVVDRGEERLQRFQDQSVVTQPAGDPGQLVPGPVADLLGLALRHGGTKECHCLFQVGVPAPGHFQSTGLKPVTCGQCTLGKLAAEPVDQGLDLPELFLPGRGVGDRL